MAAAGMRTRSFGGCGKCRARHMKCDEQRPQCSNCVAYNLECDGYTRNIFFDSNEDGPRYRQLLFTDGERQHMNNQMTRQIPLHKANATVNAIEIACEGDPSTTALQRGPFGVFRLSPITLIRRSPSPLHLDPLPEWETSLFDFEAFLQPPSPTVSDTFDQWLTSAEQPLNLEDAPLLLKHYADNVVASLTPFRHAKTPWHVLFLPNAKTTLASLAMGETIDDANLTIFYGLLAISALDLASSSSKWQAEASNLEKKAQLCLMEVLHYALDRPKVFKYKSAVMAILVMIQLSMVNGSWEQTDTYLLEAERIVRLRGLTKQSKSRKVRLLHHCYAYTRIFHESLSLASNKSSNRLMIKDAIETSGVVIPSQDPLSFRAASWQDLENESSQPKSREQGENDLHLSKPGLWTATLYPEIFGVPEMWLMLLSQIIRLANEKEFADTMSLKEYLRRAKDLERCISRGDSTIISGGPHDIVIESMLVALQNALAIYFYRRILDVDPEILQTKVMRVKEALLTCRDRAQQNGKYLNNLVWPAFIAGCEAIDIELQESFLEWFEMCIHRDAPSSLVRLRSTMQQVWLERNERDCTSTGWLLAH